MLKSLVRPLAAAGLVVAALPALAQTPTAPKPIELTSAAETVQIELRTVRVSGKAGREVVAKLFEAKDAKPCCEADCCEKAKAEPKVAFLTDAQLKSLLEQVAADRTATVMHAPKTTVLSGQTATVRTTDAKVFTTGMDLKLVDGNPVMTGKNEKVDLGTTFRVVATVSADQKFVKLGLKYHDKCLASPDVPLHPVTTMVTPVFEGGSQGTPVPFTQFIQNPKFREQAFDTTATVPNGGTLAVFAGTQKTTVRSEFGPPVLSQIPYLNRLFKNTGIAEMEQDVVVLATAKRVTPEVVMEPMRSSPYGTWPAPRAFAVLTSPPAPTHAVFIATPGHPLCTPVSALLPIDDTADLLTAYKAACANGDKDAAMRLAVQALAKDPTCFSRVK